MKKTIISLSVLIALVCFFTGVLWAQFPGMPSAPSADQPAATEQKPANQQPQPAQKDEFKGFSGKYTVYKNVDGKYQINVPEEFKLKNEGYTTDWDGPLIDSMACSMSVNWVDMAGVSSDTLYSINLKSYKEKKGEYTDVQPVKVKWGKKTALAFRVKEVTHKPGQMSKEKDPNDHHRWHLFIFGNGKSYTLGFAANYAAFKGNKVQKMFEEVIKSVELL